MKFWTSNRGPGQYWFRVLGRGMGFWDSRVKPDRFSIRYGYQRCLKIGPFRVEWLGSAQWFQLVKDEEPDV